MDRDLLTRLSQAMEKQIAGNLAEAETVYVDILHSDPDNPDANHLLGLVRSEQDRASEAVALIEKAIAINPDAAPFHHNIAGIYRRMGRLSEAEAEFRRAIDLKADYGEAYQGLAEMVRFEGGDPFISRVLEQLESPKLPESARCYLHFAAGKYLDDTRDYSAAFEHYLAGNRSTNKSFDSSEFRQQVKDTIYVFGSEYIRRHEGAGNGSEQPVFVVGMPRSGTTLVEQILASHSSVFGAGELNDMKFIARSAAQMSEIKQLYPNCVPGLSRSAYARLGEEYLKRIRSIVQGRFERVVDKHPLNFQFVGLILLMFPNAKIIHTIRHPLDTCLSCFFQNFTKGQNYSFDLNALAHFFNDYRRLMEHFESIFPRRIFSVEYEKILADQEGETRRLLDFCGLEFEQACLDFHSTERVVKTASFMQVRQPLYKTSENRWVNYTAQLQGLARIIGYPLEPPVTITGFSQILSTQDSQERR